MRDVHKHCTECGRKLSIHEYVICLDCEEIDGAFYDDDEFEEDEDFKDGDDPFIFFND